MYVLEAHLVRCYARNTYISHMSKMSFLLDENEKILQMSSGLSL